MLNFLINKIHIYLDDRLENNKKLLIIKIINILLSPIIYLTKLFLLLFNNPISRYIYFESLKNKFLIKNSDTEKYILNSSDKVVSKFLYVSGTYDFIKCEKAINICFPDIKSNPSIKLQV